jgi:hypothetical protein
MLAGCSTSGIEISGTAAQICRTWEPIRPSKKDVLTDPTAKQIAGSNAANEQWCGKGQAPRPRVS